MTAIPPTIFKYQPLNLQTLKNLKHQKIYFGSPRSFNDPFDCALTPRFTELTEIEANSILGRAISDPHSQFMSLPALQSMSNAEVTRVVTDAATKLIREQSDNFYNVRGMSCFSERNDNLLMWSHYAGQHTGFCLEFDTKYEPFQKLRKVQYSDNIPVIDTARLLLETDYENVMDLFSTKSTDWEYEQEWRAAHNKVGTEFGYAPEALRSIYFGARMSEDDIDMICLILHSLNPQVTLYCGKRSDSEFKIEFTKSTYTPWAEAKRPGLLLP